MAMGRQVAAFSLAVAGSLLDFGYAYSDATNPIAVNDLASGVVALSHLELAFGDPEHARKARLLRRRLRNAPDDAAAYFELGRLLLKEEHVNEAIRIFEVARRLKPTKPDSYLLLASALQKRSRADLPKAIWLLEEAIRLDFANADAHLNLAYALNSAGKDARAIDAFTTALALAGNPTTRLSAHIGLIAAYRKVGDEAAAGEHFRAARGIFPGIDEVFIRQQIARETPTPRYAGNLHNEEAGTHPTYDKRISEVLKRIEQRSSRHD